MSRIARLDTPGLLHYIMVRRIERQKIFNDDKDHENFIARLATLLPETKAQCYAWSSLSNHARFLLRSGRPCTLFFRGAMKIRLIRSSWTLGTPPQGSCEERKANRSRSPAEWRRHRRVNLAALFFAMFFLLIASCSNSEPGDTGKSPSSSKDAQTGGELRIVIRWGGDDFASKQDLEMKARIERLIEESKVGQVTRSGTGMGWMDIWVRAKDKREARRAIHAIMKEVAPRSRFSIE
jgi:hypothetical protein